MIRYDPIRSQERSGILSCGKCLRVYNSVFVAVFLVWKLWMLKLLCRSERLGEWESWTTRWLVDTHRPVQWRAWLRDGRWPNRELHHSELPNSYLAVCLPLSPCQPPIWGDCGQISPVTTTVRVLAVFLLNMGRRTTGLHTTVLHCTTGTTNKDDHLQPSTMRHKFVLK